MTANCHIAITQDGAVIVDFDQDRLFKLNRVAAQMWALLNTGTAAAEIAEKIAHDYSVDPSRVEQDLNNLIARISEFGLSPQSALISALPESKPSPGSLPIDGSGDLTSCNTVLRTVIFWKALVGLLLFDIILSFLSLQDLCSVVRSWPTKTLPSYIRSHAISLVLGAVNKACVWYPKKTLCLQRSAVTTCLLREVGTRASMIVGVRPMPMLAHAWVEVDHIVIGDFPRVQSFYQSVTSY